MLSVLYTGMARYTLTVGDKERRYSLVVLKLSYSVFDMDFDRYGAMSENDVGFRT